MILEMFIGLLIGFSSVASICFVIHMFIYHSKFAPSVTFGIKMFRKHAKRVK